MLDPCELVDNIRASETVADECLHDYRICVQKACAEHPALRPEQARVLRRNGLRDVLVALALRDDADAVTAELKCRMGGFGWMVDYRRTGSLVGCPVRIVGWGTRGIGP